MRALAGGGRVTLFAPFFLAARTAVSALAAQAGPITDPSAINVCERVPGADLAKALGKALRSERRWSSRTRS